VLAEHCSFLEVAYLILFGDLPAEAELKTWVSQITYHTSEIFRARFDLPNIHELKGYRQESISR
jgi:citrate synthase